MTWRTLLINWPARALDEIIRTFLFLDMAATILAWALVWQLRIWFIVGGLLCLVVTLVQLALWAVGIPWGLGTPAPATPPIIPDGPLA